MKNQTINSCNYCYTLTNGIPCMPFTAHSVLKRVYFIYLYANNQYFISTNERNALQIYLGIMRYSPTSALLFRLFVSLFCINFVKQRF